MNKSQLNHLQYLLLESRYFQSHCYWWLDDDWEQYKTIINKEKTIIK